MATGDSFFGGNPNDNKRMKSGILRTIAGKLGIDKAIAYSSGARIFQALAGVVSIFFIAAFLTGDEQGYYYTFASILAIQIFFELGFTDIMTQYVAHEAAHLKLNGDLRYEGEERYRSRLTYLIHFCLKWYLVIAIAFFIVVNIVGFVFFSSYGTEGAEINWKMPWLLLSFSTSIKLLQSPFTAIFSGLGKVKEMMQISFYQQLVIPVSQWVLFACGLKLYVVGIGSMLGALIWFVFILRSELKDLFLNLFREKVTEKISYFKEIFPYQWRIAVSWISGYFIFQLFNPVLFATEGPVVAGQMGMTLNVMNAIQALVLSWQNTKVPAYSAWIEMKQYKQLDKVFNQTTRQVMLICSSLLAIMFAGVWFLRVTHMGFRDSELGSRFLDYVPMAILFIPYLVNQMVNSWAIYLRCHKQEPYLITSIAGGVLQCLSVFTVGKIFGLYGIVIGYATIAMVLFPVNYFIFKRKKHEWHQDGVSLAGN